MIESVLVLGCVTVNLVRMVSPAWSKKEEFPHLGFLVVTERAATELETVKMMVMGDDDDDNDGDGNDYGVVTGDCGDGGNCGGNDDGGDCGGNGDTCIFSPARTSRLV